jgi:hypothetical protein
VIQAASDPGGPELEPFHHRVRCLSFSANGTTPNGDNSGLSKRA